MAEEWRRVKVGLFPHPRAPHAAHFPWCVRLLPQHSQNVFGVCPPVNRTHLLHPLIDVRVVPVSPVFCARVVLRDGRAVPRAKHRHAPVRVRGRNRNSRAQRIQPVVEVPWELPPVFLHLLDSLPVGRLRVGKQPVENPPLLRLRRRWLVVAPARAKVVRRAVEGREIVADLVLRGHHFSFPSKLAGFGAASIRGGGRTNHRHIEGLVASS
mmetsp:Transcript_12293/g.29821  ORF Transcript_12293/g.29821 Transcript_12293/m.29821 type:complete len:211 (+) Transcript_12293:4906-5538(+)